MKKLIYIIFALSLLPQLACAESSGYTKADVRKDALDYINTVFGNKTPTLSDYLRFGGKGAEEEEFLTRQECKKLFPGEDPEYSKQCADFEAKRMSHKDSVSSLYFGLVRKKLKSKASSLRIKKIYSLKPIYAYRIDVKDTKSGLKMTLGHVKQRGLAQLGLIGIIEVNGKPVKKYLGLNYWQN